GDRCETAGSLDGARAQSLEWVVATGVKHQDHDASTARLQAVDNALHRKRGIAHQLLLPVAGRGDVGGQKVGLAVNLKAMAGKEEQRRVTELDCPVECQKCLAH